MTKRRVGVSNRNWFEGSQVSNARPAAPFYFTFDVAEGTSFVIQSAAEGSACFSTGA
jgi:hypothetical protein